MPTAPVNQYFMRSLLAGQHVAVTPSDTVDLPGGIAALYVGVGGNVTINDISGTAATYQNVPAGSVLPTLVSRVLATGTGASGLIALY